MSPDIFCQ